MKPELKNNIDIELANIEIVTNEADNLFKLIGNKEPDNVQKTALAAFATQFYNGIENILKRILKSYSIPLPVGDDWHIKLIHRFSENSDLEVPLKFDNELFTHLSELRRFRHYFFHGYSINIDWTILKESIAELPVILDLFKASLGKL
ncbi:hypothetical protein ACFLSQ_09390 [Bacteroidota bacterium]